MPESSTTFVALLARRVNHNILYNCEVTLKALQQLWLAPFQLARNA